MTIKGKTVQALILIILVLAGYKTVLAKEYFVSNLTEFYKLPDLTAGDVVVLKNGVWKDAWLKFEGTGTEENPITLKAESGGQVYLTGNSSIQIGGEYLIVDGFVLTQGAKSSGQIISFRTSTSKPAYHCRLTNTKIYNFNPDDKDTEYKWVSLYGQYNRVDHCHFEGKTNNGALLVVWLDEDGMPNHHQIDSNYFGYRPDLGYNGGETIRIGTSDYSMNDSYTTVEHNVFEECDGEIEIISNKSCKNVYRYNTFRNSAGTLTLRHGNECEVYGNFFFGAKNKECGGIRIIGENHKVYNNYLQDLPDDGFRAAISLTNGVPNSPLNRYFQVINAQVVNNTIVNCKYPLVIGAGSDGELTLPPKDCFIANNVVADYASATREMVYYRATPENMTLQNNIMYGADLGIDSQEGILEEDPELIFSDIWRPSESSKVVNYGANTFSFITEDIDGQRRGGTNDVGCDQLSTETINRMPLNKSDVGITWSDTLSYVAYLSGLQLDNENIKGFYPNVYNYTAIVDDASSYEISAEKQDNAASVVIEYPETLPDICTVTVTAENKVNTKTYTISLTAKEVDGIKINSNENSIMLYPNPCENIVVIETIEYGYAQIYDLTGRLVQKLLIDDSVTSHDVSGLNAGFYQVVFRQRTGFISMPLIIK